MARRSATEMICRRSVRSSVRRCRGRSGRRAPRPSARTRRAVDDQVGVAADRRGEVGVAAEVQAEVADVVGAVYARLLLRVRSITSLTMSAFGRRSRVIGRGCVLKRRRCAAPRSSGRLMFRVPQEVDERRPASPPTAAAWTRKTSGLALCSPALPGGGVGLVTANSPRSAGAPSSAERGAIARPAFVVEGSILCSGRSRLDEAALYRAPSQRVR